MSISLSQNLNCLSANTQASEQECALETLHSAFFSLNQIGQFYLGLVRSVKKGSKLGLFFFFGLSVL